MITFVLDASAVIELFARDEINPDLRRRVLTGSGVAPELRDTLTAYDAAYVALAELIGVPIITCDAKLAQANGRSALHVCTWRR